MEFDQALWDEHVAARDSLLATYNTDSALTDSDRNDVWGLVSDVGAVVYGLALHCPDTQQRRRLVTALTNAMSDAAALYKAAKS